MTWLTQYKTCTWVAHTVTHQAHTCSLAFIIQWCGGSSNFKGCFNVNTFRCMKTEPASLNIIITRVSL